MGCLGQDSEDDGMHVRWSPKKGVHVGFGPVDDVYECGDWAQNGFGMSTLV